MKILVVAPHPDDEVLGCGGTLARFRREHPDVQIDWMIVTEIKQEWGFSAKRISERNYEIEAVINRLKPVRVHRLGFRPAYLDATPLAELVAAVGIVIDAVQPDTIFTPWRHDVHSDHGAVFNAVVACVKSFRYPSVRTVLSYETISETDFALDPAVASFKPNVWVDITNDLEAKLDLLACYPSETKKFPFPRSGEAVMSQARARGIVAGVEAAEAFVLLKGVI